MDNVCPDLKFTMISTMLWSKHLVNPSYLFCFNQLRPQLNTKQIQVAWAEEVESWYLFHVALI